MRCSSRSSILKPRHACYLVVLFVCRGGQIDSLFRLQGRTSTSGLLSHRTVAVVRRYLFRPLIANRTPPRPWIDVCGKVRGRSLSFSCCPRQRLPRAWEKLWISWRQMSQGTFSKCLCSLFICSPNALWCHRCLDRISQKRVATVRRIFQILTHVGEEQCRGHRWHSPLEWAQSAFHSRSKCWCPRSILWITEESTVTFLSLHSIGTNLWSLWGAKDGLEEKFHEENFSLKGNERLIVMGITDYLE